MNCNCRSKSITDFKQTDTVKVEFWKFLPLKFPLSRLNLSRWLVKSRSDCWLIKNRNPLNTSELCSKKSMDKTIWIFFIVKTCRHVTWSSYHYGHVRTFCVMWSLCGHNNPHVFTMMGRHMDRWWTSVELASPSVTIDRPPWNLVTIDGCRQTADSNDSA